jgi:hypothetical protein
MGCQQNDMGYGKKMMVFDGFWRQKRMANHRMV